MSNWGSLKLKRLRITVLTYYTGNPNMYYKIFSVHLTPVTDPSRVHLDCWWSPDPTLRTSALAEGLGWGVGGSRGLTLRWTERDRQTDRRD